MIQYCQIAIDDGNRKQHIHKSLNKGVAVSVLANDSRKEIKPNGKERLF